MTPVVLRDPLGDMFVVDAMRASASDRDAAMATQQASFRLRAWCWRGADVRALAQLNELAFDHVIPVSRATQARAVLERRVVEAVELGRLLVIVRPRRQVVLPVALEPEAVLGPEDEPTSWIELELFDDAGQPVPDEPYQIVTGDGRSRSGALDWRGRAREDGIDPGDCKVTFPRRYEWRAA